MSRILDKRAKIAGRYYFSFNFNGQKRKCKMAGQSASNAGINAIVFLLAANVENAI